MTNGQSASLSWCQAPIWGLRPDFRYCQTAAGLLMWGALSIEKTGLSKSSYNWWSVSQSVLVYDLISVIVIQLCVYWCGAPFLMRGQVRHLQLLLALASAVVLKSESYRTHDHILLSLESRLHQPRGSGPCIYITHFHCLLWLAGLQWRYSNLPPHGLDRSIIAGLHYIASAKTT
jgi:hypothetical protein